MLVIYLCLFVISVGIILVKFIDLNEVHALLVIVSIFVILGWSFLLSPLPMKLILSLAILGVCQRIYEIAHKL